MNYWGSYGYQQQTNRLPPLYNQTENKSQGSFRTNRQEERFLMAITKASAEATISNRSRSPARTPRQSVQHDIDSRAATSSLGRPRSRSRTPTRSSSPGRSAKSSSKTTTPRPVKTPAKKSVRSNSKSREGTPRTSTPKTPKGKAKAKSPKSPKSPKTPKTPKSTTKAGKKRAVAGSKRGADENDIGSSRKKSKIARKGDSTFKSPAKSAAARKRVSFRGDDSVKSLMNSSTKSDNKQQTTEQSSWWFCSLM